MGSTRRSFTPEYKEQSVAFVIDGGLWGAKIRIGAVELQVHGSGTLV
jgi:transposase-like protein